MAEGSFATASKRRVPFRRVVHLEAYDVALLDCSCVAVELWLPSFAQT